MSLFRRALLSAGALLLVLTPAGLASSAGGTTEYPLPTPDQQPTGIVSAPDGSLWFAEISTSALGSVTPGGTVSSLSGLSGPAQDVTVGPDSNLWATEPNAGKIARVTLPGHTIAEYTLPSGRTPYDITAGPDGNLWFTDQGGSGAIGMITPTGTVSTYTTGLSHNAKPAGITTGPDGNLWFTESGGAGAIATITPSGAITEYPAPASGFIGTPTSIVAGPDHALWFTEAGNPGAIGRIDPTTDAITQYRTGLAAHADPRGIAAGSDGNLYFTDAGSPSQIGRITPAGIITEVPVATPTANPDTITFGPDGKLWFTEPTNPGSIGTAPTSVFTADGGGGGSDPTGSAGNGLTGAAPAATTEPATHLTPASARLNGTSPDAIAGDTYHFDWGTTGAYGSSTRETTITHGTITSGRMLSAELGGLTPETTYHARLVVSSCGGCAAGTTEGADITFTTRAPAAPQLGRSTVTAALGGTIAIKRPGGHGFTVLSGPANIPNGSIIDTTRGRLRITSALPGGGTEAATVWGGQLAVSQNRVTGMTTFRLVGALRCTTAGTERPAALTRVGATGSRRPSVRRLWAHDNHGLYTTRGHNSVATVRGTVWETVDSCAGTRTVVARGVVAVHDLRRHRTVLVTAGHSYLARR